MLLYANYVTLMLFSHSLKLIIGKFIICGDNLIYIIILLSGMFMVTWTDSCAQTVVNYLRQKDLCLVTKKKNTVDPLKSFLVRIVVKISQEKPI